MGKKCVSFVFRTDVHVADKGPSSWKGDYAEEIWSSLEQVGKFAARHDASAVLDGGDYFHVKTASRNSHALIYRTAEIHKHYPCPTYCVEGNHDITYNNLGSIERQPLGVLYASGVFNHLREEVFKSGGVQVRVVGVPYNPKQTLENLRAIQKQPEDDYLVAVVHALAGEDPPAKVEEFFGEPVFKYQDLVTPNGPDVFCFPPDTLVLDHLYRPRPIKSVESNSLVADSVYHTPVEAVHPRRFVTEDLIDLEVEGLPKSLFRSTSEHPYWVASNMHCYLPSRKDRRCHPDKGKDSYPCSNCSNQAEVAAGWCESGNIQVGDYVALPVPEVEDGRCSPSLARLLGYYLAEGHIIKNRKGAPVAGVGWSFHENEIVLHDDVRRIVREEFGLECHLYKTPGKAIQICAYGKDIAAFFSEHGGRYSHLKSLSDWIWSKPYEDRLELLRGWTLGDGHSRAEKIEVMGSTASNTLVYQLMFLALSLRLSPRYSIRPPQEHQNHAAHILSFYGDSGAFLARSLGCRVASRSKTKVSGFFHGGFYYTRVKKVSRVPYSGYVHNFRTTSNEYLVSGVLVHNCFGHWHKDQGVVRIKDKQFVNHGALSRGALTHENMSRTPKVSLLEFTRDKAEVTLLPLKVLPAEDVFDVEQKERGETEGKSIDAFVERLQADVQFDSEGDITDNLSKLDFAAEVRDLAMGYLEQVRSKG